MRLLFDLAFPPTALRPNARTHPIRRARIARTYGNEVWIELRAQYGPRPLVPPFGRARLDFEAVYPSGAGIWDDDAVIAAFKSGRDALVRFGLLPDDAPRYLRLGGVTTRIDRTLRVARLRITLTSIDKGASTHA